MPIVGKILYYLKRWCPASSADRCSVISSVVARFEGGVIYGRQRNVMDDILIGSAAAGVTSLHPKTGFGIIAFEGDNAKFMTSLYSTINTQLKLDVCFQLSR
jgi:hypothetical protein